MTYTEAVERVMHLWASTRAQRPDVAWEWRLAPDVWDALSEGGRWDSSARLLGWAGKVDEGYSPGLIGLVA